MGDLAKQVDVHVGHLIRKQRILVGLTHQDLADAIGLSCEQIHKYESGILRIIAGRFYVLAQILTVDSKDWTRLH